MNGAAQSGTIGGSLFNDNSPYKDLNQDEKIERTHIIVRTLLQKINILGQQLAESKMQMQEHRHNKDGEPVIIKRLNGGLVEERNYPIAVAPASQSYGPGLLPDGPDAFF